MKSNFVTELGMNRRQALKASLAFSGLALGGMGAAAAATSKGRLNYSDPYDNLYAFVKIWSSYEEPCVGAFSGLMYVRLPGKRMIPVFGYTGTGALLAKIDDDGNLWIKSRETGYFTDRKSVV